MCIVLEATIDTTKNARLLLLAAPQLIDLSMRLNGGRVPLSLEVIDYATFFLLKM